MSAPLGVRRYLAEAVAAVGITDTRTTSLNRRITVTMPLWTTLFILAEM